MIVRSHIKKLSLIAGGMLLLGIIILLSIKIQEPQEPPPPPLTEKQKIEAEFTKNAVPIDDEIRVQIEKEMGAKGSMNDAQKKQVEYTYTRQN